MSDYLIECSSCKSIVAASVHGEIEVQPYDDVPAEKVSLVQCLRCGEVLLGTRQNYVEWDEGTEEWSQPSRVWPESPAELSLQIPHGIRNSLEEGQKCLRVGAFTASVVMTGRALEGICQHFETKSSNFFNGLKELLDRDIIDTKFYRWSDELRKRRNLAAHPTNTQISELDANDIWDFANTICEYIFVLSVRFERFLERAKETDERHQNARVLTGDETAG